MRCSAILVGIRRACGVTVTSIPSVWESLAGISSASDSLSQAGCEVNREMLVDTCL
jgi:hypothetical protein